MRKWILGLAALAVVSVSAQAGGGGPMNATRHQYVHGKPVLPVYQAAPWYLYWPYDGHFQTAAPLQGAFYAPPIYGFQAQPYFPASPLNQFPMAPQQIVPGR